MGCQQNTVSQQDPLCLSCIEQACHSQSENFESHVQQASPKDAAQVIAIMERFPGCTQKYPNLIPIREKAYHNFGSAFYASEQPWYPDRGMHAFQDMIKSIKNRTIAHAYLSSHIQQWRDEPWAQDQLTELEKYIDQSEDIFALFAQISDKEKLTQISSLPQSPKRDEALIYRWKDLPQDAQIRVLQEWISAKWTMQTSGSSQLPQYLTLDWKKRPLPKDVPDFTAALVIQTIRINNREVKKRDNLLKSAINWPPLKSPGQHHHRFDLQPWLNTADNYRISAKASIEIWPTNVQQACLNHEESCQDKPLAVLPAEFDKQYRVFVGVETGAPRRHKVDADNLKTSKALQLDICSDETCVFLWNGEKTKDRPAISVVQGHDFYIKSTANHADFPIASRLMARQGEGHIWREIAAFFTFAPQAYDIPVRADVDLGDLCHQIGPCKLELQLRPSLRFARRDPRITRYWGSTLELGNITLDLQNQTAKQIWSSIQKTPSP